MFHSFLISISAIIIIIINNNNNNHHHHQLCNNNNNNNNKDNNNILSMAMDNFYTLVPLLNELQRIRVNACGTIHNNWGDLPMDLLLKIAPL
jgi:hypothetical protein